MDYEDEHIRVGSLLIHRHLINEKIQISKKEVVRRGIKGELFPQGPPDTFFPLEKIAYQSISRFSEKRGKY